MTPADDGRWNHNLHYHPLLLRELPEGCGRALAASSALRLVRRRRESPAPTIWPPGHTFAEVRVLAEGLLPGVAARRHLLLRYSLVWTKPAA